MKDLMLGRHLVLWKRSEKLDETERNGVTFPEEYTHTDFLFEISTQDRVQCLASVLAELRFCVPLPEKEWFASYLGVEHKLN
jgi:hypothetical protein